MLPRDLRWGDEWNGWQNSQDLYDTRTKQRCQAYRRVVNYTFGNDKDRFSCHYPTGLPLELRRPDHPPYVKTRYFDTELDMLCWLTFCEEAS